MKGWATAATRRILAAIGGLAAMLVLAAPGVASADWVKAESARFIVYGAGDERDVRAYAEKLEGFEEILRAYHGMAPNRRRRASSRSTGRGRQPAEPGQAGRRRRPRAASTRPAWRGCTPWSAATYGDDFILFHEYTHHFMHQHFPYGYPAWVVEGYAEYFGGTPRRRTATSTSASARGGGSTA